MARARRTNTAKTPPSKMNIGGYDDDNNDKRSRGQVQWRLTSCIGYLLKFLKNNDIGANCINVHRTSIDKSICQRRGEWAIYTHENWNGILYLLPGRYYLQYASSATLISGKILLASRRPPQQGGGATKTTMTRIIAFSFLMSIVCNQFPRWLSALVACLTIFAFGLASRQLQSTICCILQPHRTH